MAVSGNVEMARLLVGRGADVNARTDRDWTVLMGAAEYSHVEVARFFGGTRGGYQRPR